MRRRTIALTNAAIVVTAAGVALVTPVTTRASTKNDKFHLESLVGIEVSADDFFNSLYREKVGEIEKKILTGEVSADQGVRLIHQVEDSDRRRFLGLKQFKNNMHLKYSMEELAEFLNVTQEELRILRIAEKMSILEIATEQGVSEKQLKDFLIKEHLELLETTNLTDGQKDKLTDRFIEHLDTLINFKPGEFNGKMSQNFQSKIPLI